MLLNKITDTKNHDDFKEKTMLELLLNYVTVTIATILFVGLVGVLIFKRKKLTKSKKAILYLLCAIVAIYFIFVGIVTFAFGNPHPLGEPSPTFDPEPYDTFSFSELQPEQMQAYKDELILPSDNAEIDYIVTWTPSGMKTEIGLVAEDGTEYFSEAEGGSAKGSITDIPTGTYQIVIRNSKDNLNLKSTTDKLAISGAVSFWIATSEETTNRQDYNKITQKHNYNWKIGLQTQDDLKNLGTLLILDNNEDYLNFELGFSGEKSDNFETQIRVYYDYKPISFNFNKDDEFSYYYDFSMENHSEYTLDLLLNPQNLIEDDKIHKLFVTATTGNKSNAKDLKLSNAAYGTSVIYDVTHNANYTDFVNVQSESFSTHDSFIKVGNNVFSPRTFNVNQDKQFNYKNEMSGLSISLPVYEVAKNSIEFNSFVSSLKDNEDFLVLICLNFEPYMWAYISELKSAGTYFSEFIIDLPEESANYEFTAYTIPSPFEKISDVENQFVQSSNRFTIVKSQSTE